MFEKEFNGTGFISSSWPLKKHLPTLIFISGASSCSTFWNMQVIELSKTFNTLAVDLPGHGRSTGNGEKKISQYAEAVKNFITEIQPPYPILCGFSMGGAVTLELLTQKPNTVSAGIVINSGARLKILPLLLKKIREKKKENFNFENLFTEMALSKKSDSTRLKPIVEASSNSNTQVTINDIYACNAFNVKNNLSKIDVPVLIITSEDDVITPLEKGVYLAENIKNSKLINIKDAGHLSPIEQPEQVNAAISNFVMETHPYKNLKN